MVDGSAHLPFDGLVDDQLADASAGIRQEIAASSVCGDVVELRDGRCVGSVAGEYLWSFEVDRDIAPEPETPAQLHAGRDTPTDVRVVAVGDGSIVLATGVALGDEIPAAGLVLDVAFVYQRLIDRLEEFVGVPLVDGGLFDQLVMPDPFEPADDTGGGMSMPDPDEDQRRIAAAAVEPGVRFTWGPPGTGKTRVLAMAVADAARRGDRVLVLAHSNAAVDVAIARIVDVLAGDPLLADGRVLRIGTPQQPEVMACSEVLPVSQVELHHPELATALASLTQRRASLSDELRGAADDDGRATLTKELDRVRSDLRVHTAELRSLTIDLIDDAAVVATTLSRAVIDDQLWSGAFDVIVLDEASMAPLPFVLALSLRDADTLSFFGDFRQLPPICVSSDDAAQRWFARDVFDFADVRQAREQGLVDPRLSILRTQFRMGEQICEVVNQYAYDGLLRTHVSARDRAIRLAECEPAPGSELVVVDTSELGAACMIEMRADSHSRLNPLTAMLAVALADQLVAAGCESVGLIAPYRAQAQLMAPFATPASLVDAATIHRFQGSERDAIVFDLTDAPDRTGPSLLTGGDKDRAARLFNVAVSRARGKLVVIADLEFVGRRFPIGSPFRQLLSCIDDSGGEIIPAVAIIDQLVGATSSTMSSRSETALTWCADWSGAVRCALQAQSPDEPIEINLPSGTVTPSLIDQITSHPDAASITVRCTPVDAARLEHTQARLRLQMLGSNPWMLVGAHVVALGSATPDTPSAVALNPRLVAAFRRSVTPAEGR